MDQEKYIPEIQQLIDEHRFFELKNVLDESAPADVEELLNNVRSDDWLIVFRLLPKELAADVFSELEPNEQADLLSRFRDFRIRDIIQELDPDDRTELFEELPAEIVDKLIGYLEPADRKEALRLLGYPEESVGREMTPEFVALREDWTVKQSLDFIRNSAPDTETIYTAYVLGPRRKLLGVLSLRDIILARDDEIISEIMNPNPIIVSTRDDREEAARILAKYDFLALPVVDSQGFMVGIVTVDDVIEVLEDEATEDIERMASIEPIDSPYLNVGPWGLVKSRVFWLATLLLLQGFTASIMGRFEDLIAGMVLITFFVPTLVGVGGNTGSQISAMIIRGLSVGDISSKDIRRIIGKELLVGLILAVILSILLFGRALLLEPKFDVAFAVSIALGAVVLYSNLIGAVLPIGAKKVGLDPAVMAGPVITTLVDITGIAMYFGIIKLIF